MCTLRSFENAWSYARFDPSSGRLSKRCFIATLIRRPQKIQGWYTYSGAYLAMLYVHAGGLYFRSGARTVEITAKSSVALTREGRRCRLEVRTESEQVAFEYTAPRIWPPITEDPTPFVEEADFDFGMFVRNIIADSNRQRRVIEHLGHNVV
jgi:hypothetical protein